MPVITIGQVNPVSVEPPSKGGTIKGRVLAADTNLGLSKATITVLTPDGGLGEESKVVRTSENGNFEVSALKAGRYYVFASRSGYLSQFYGQKLPSVFPERTGSTLLHLRNGETCSDIDFRLVRHGAIEGRVVDASGEPMARATIQLSRYGHVEGRRRLVSTGRASRAQTDDRGHFRLFEIPPGSYYLHARRDFAVQAAEGDRSAAPPTYYPGVLDPQEATRIEVGPGAEIQGVDLVLLEVSGFNISGHVVVAHKGVDREVSVLARRFASDGTLGLFYANSSVDRTGRFILRNVIPGKYLVTARSDDFSPRAVESGILSGIREVEVTDTDVSEVTIAVGLGGEIEGRIEWPGGTPADVRRIYVRVFPEGDFEAFYPGQGEELTQDLRFKLKGVSEGRFRLRIELPPGPHYVKSIRLDGREVVDQSFEIRNNDHLRAAVTIAVDGAELAGIAETTSSEVPARGATVLALADLRASPRFRRLTHTDQNGRFSLRGLPPGNYLVAAVSSLERGGETDPEFLKSFEKVAKRVDLSAGQVLNETLTVIPALLP